MNLMICPTYWFFGFWGRHCVSIHYCSNICSHFNYIMSFWKSVFCCSFRMCFDYNSRLLDLVFFWHLLCFQYVFLVRSSSAALSDSTKSSRVQHSSMEYCLGVMQWLYVSVTTLAGVGIFVFEVIVYLWYSLHWHF